MTLPSMHHSRCFTNNTTEVQRSEGSKEYRAAKGWSGVVSSSSVFGFPVFLCGPDDMGRSQQDAKSPVYGDKKSSRPGDRNGDPGKKVSVSE